MDNLYSKDRQDTQIFIEDPIDHLIEFLGYVSLICSAVYITYNVIRGS